MTDRHRCAQRRRRRGFELGDDERHRNRTTTVVLDNEGDEDSLLYGSPSFHDRDRFEGTGVSASREVAAAEQDGWTVNVNDHERFNQLRAQEQALAEAEESLTTCRQKIESIELNLTGLRREAVEMQEEYGSIDPDLIRRGTFLSGRLADLQELEAYYQHRVNAARDNLRQLEAAQADEADATCTDRSDYNTTHWNHVYRWGQELLNRLGWQLPKLSNHDVEQLLAKLQVKRRRRELTFEHYVHFTGLLNREMHRRTGAVSYLTRRNKMASLWKRYRLAERKNTAVFVPDDEVLFDPSSRQYADAKLSEHELVQAIDLRIDAARIATNHNVTVEEAVSMLATD
jgi:chromosome segregation ATPase